MSYTNSDLRERLKNKILSSNKGGKPGQWSARKAQILAREYKAEGGSYSGGLNKKAKSLKKWTRQKWQASDGGNSRRTTKSGKTITKKYLPKKAWKNLDKKEIQALDRSKRKAEKQGKQFSKSPKKLTSKISNYWK